jgi:hypothetical protein
LAAAVNHATKQRTLGWIAAGIWFAAYGHSGFFYDLNRTDALAAFFLMAAYAAAFWRSGPAAGALAGLLLAAAAMTKQDRAAFLAPLVFAQLLRRDWRGAAALAAVFLAAFYGAVVWLNHASDGWFSRLTLQMVKLAPIPRRASLFALPFLRHCAATSAVIAAGIAIRAAQRRWRELVGDPWLGFWATGVVMSFVFQLSGGGWINHNILVDLPTAAASCIALPEIAAWCRARWAFARRPVAAWLLPALAALLVFSTWSSAKGQIPPPDQWQAARQVREFIRRQPGPVLVVDFLPPEPNVIRINYMGYLDLHKVPSRFRWKEGWPQRVEAELRAARPAAVLAYRAIQKDAGYAELTAGMERRRLPKRLRVQAVTGKPTALAYVWTPEPDGAAGTADK